MLVDLIQTTYVKKGNDPHWPKSKTIWIIEDFLREPPRRTHDLCNFQNLNYPSFLAFAFWCVAPKTACGLSNFQEFCLRARRKNKFSHPVARVLAPVYTLGGGGDRDSELITGMVRASWAGSHRPS